MRHALLLHLLTAGSLAWIPNGVAVSAEEAAVQLFDMDAIRDASTLDATVIEDWHVVDGRTPSRQKVVEITVGEAYPGKDYRVRRPVRGACGQEGQRPFSHWGCVGQRHQGGRLRQRVDRGRCGTCKDVHQ